MSVITDTRAEWLAARRRGLGGSDAPAIVGLHPWLSPLALYLEKTGEYVPADVPSEPMEWGIRLEPVVADKWAEVNGRRLLRFPPYDPASILAHPDRPWMLANLDGVVVDDGRRWEAVYEGKTCSAWAADDWDDDIPAHVLVQVQWQLAVTGLPRGEVACLIGGQRYVQATVERDDDLIADLTRAGEKFWQRILDRDPPPADGYQSTTDALKARFADTVAEAVELGADGLEIVQRRHRAKAEADAAAAEQNECENRLRQLLGENEMGLVFGEVAVTWKANKNGVRRLIVKEIV